MFNVLSDFGYLGFNSHGTGMHASKETLVKTIVRLRFFITAACLLAGWLAGVNVERYLVNVPAWRKVDILAWAEFSKHAYFLNGFLLFQFAAAGSFVLLFISCWTVVKNRFRYISWPLYTATFFAFAGILLTFKAAPVMLNIDQLNNDKDLLKLAFEEYHHWGAIRAIFQVASFFACVLAMGRSFVIKYVRI